MRYENGGTFFLSDCVQVFNLRASADPHFCFVLARLEFHVAGGLHTLAAMPPFVLLFFFLSFPT